MSPPSLGLVCCAAGGVEQIRAQLIDPLLADGWTVAVTATPTAAAWLYHNSEIARIEENTGFPVRSQPRMPWENSPHPAPDIYAVVPATANTIAKLALGIADNQALTTICEAIGAATAPVVVFPRINAAHARQPAWDGHIAALRNAGAQLIYGDHVWPLHEPRAAPSRDLPWQAILDEIYKAAVR